MESTILQYGAEQHTTCGLWPAIHSFIPLQSYFNMLLYYTPIMTDWKFKNQRVYSLSYLLNMIYMWVLFFLTKSLAF